MRKPRPRYLKPDIYSEGTLRLRDVAEAQFSALDSIRLSRSDRAQVYKAKQAYRRLAKKHFNRSMDFSGDTSTLDFYVNEALVYILDEHCAPYCYWGSSYGDGACIGVWPHVEGVEADLRDGELIYTADASDTYRGLHVTVSDHGNMTLYMRVAKDKDIEIWGVV